MATISTNTVSISSDLDVISRYEALVRTSLGGESVYARLKDTVEKLVKDGDLSDTERAKVVADVIGGLSNSISNASMQTALQWASAEKDIALKKLELAKQLDALDADKALKEAQTEKLEYESIATQAQTIRLMGTPDLEAGSIKVTRLAEEGKHYSDIQVTDQQKKNLEAEKSLLDSRLEESFANIHKIVADTVTNYGAWNYDAKLTKSGFSTTPTRNTPPADVKPLSDMQRLIAREQAKGYTYNAWSNAVTASAGMVGTGIASESVGNKIDGPLQKFINALEKLEELVMPTDIV